MADSPFPPTDDLDLRLVRYFTVVAETRHFGRAAERLHIAQPHLSRRMQSLEQQLGARLLDRGPQGTCLTEAGEAFLPRARALLRSAAQAAAAARSAARPSRITVGHTIGIDIVEAVHGMHRRHPEVEVRTMRLDWGETRDALLARRVDAAVTRLPLITRDLHVTVLYDEPRELLVPVTHRLAGKKSVTLDDIADEPMPVLPDPAWNAFWRVDPRPDGRPAPGGPAVEAPEDKVELIAAGQSVAIAAPGFSGVRPDLATVPLLGVEPSRVVLAIRADEHDRHVAAFGKVAAQYLAGPVAGDSDPAVA